MQATIAGITALQAAAGVTEDSLLNFVVSDGATLVATRFASENTQVSVQHAPLILTGGLPCFAHTTASPGRNEKRVSLE